MGSVLVCHDGSAYANVCCQYAAALPLSPQDRARVLYVSDLRQFEVPVIADLSGSLGLQPYEGLISQLNDFERRKAAHIEAYARACFADQGRGDRVEFHHRTGLLVDTIEDFDEAVDLILMGKRGENANFATGHLGSTMERVVRASRCPCLVTSRGLRELRKFAIGYDGSDSARRALEFAVDSPLLPKPAEVHLLTVSEEERHQDRDASTLARGDELLRARGLTPHCQHLAGVAEDAIARYVDEQGIDLVVIGAYGRSPIRQFFLGSTTSEMIRRCKTPLLCCR